MTPNFTMMSGDMMNISVHVYLMNADFDSSSVHGGTIEPCRRTVPFVTVFTETHIHT